MSNIDEILQNIKYDNPYYCMKCENMFMQYELVRGLCAKCREIPVGKVGRCSRCGGVSLHTSKVYGKIEYHISICCNGWRKDFVEMDKYQNWYTVESVMVKDMFGEHEEKRFVGEGHIAREGSKTGLCGTAKVKGMKVQARSEPGVPLCDKCVTMFKRSEYGGLAK